MGAWLLVSLSGIMHLSSARGTAAQYPSRQPPPCRECPTKKKKGTVIARGERGGGGVRRKWWCAGSQCRP